jgi:hypothetical protein
VSNVADGRLAGAFGAGDAGSRRAARRRSGDRRRRGAARTTLDEVTALDLEVETFSAALPTSRARTSARSGTRSRTSTPRSGSFAGSRRWRIGSPRSPTASGRAPSRRRPRRSAAASSSAVAAAARAARAALAWDEAPEDPEDAAAGDEADEETAALEPEGSR